MSSFYDDASLVVIPSGYKTSKVYAEKPTDGSGDLTFTRTGDTATRVNSAGLVEKVRTNVLTYSQNFTNAAWTKSNVSATGGQTDPNGGTTASLIQTTTASSAYFYQTQTGAKAFSIYAKAGTRSSFAIINGAYNQGAGFNLATQTVTNAGAGSLGKIESVGGGWYRCSVYVSSSTEMIVMLADVSGGGMTIGDNLTFAFSQAETGDIATAYIPTTTAAVSVGPVANVPRLDYLGSTCPRLILEGQRTNLALYSEQFNNAAYTLNNATITANTAVSPDGYTNADTYTAAGSGNFINGFGSSSGSNTITYSIFAKAGTQSTFRIREAFYFGTSVIFDLSTGTVTSGTGTITSYGNGWYRCTLTQAYGAGQGNLNVIFDNTAPSGTTYLYGFQAEVGTYATSYIPTLAASATRAKDDCYKFGISSLIGQTEGTLFLEFDFVSGLTANYGIIYQAAFNTYIYINQQTSGSISGQVQGVGGFAFTVAKPSGRYKCALAYKSGDSAFFVNGVQVGTTNTTTFTPVTMDQFSFTVSDETNINSQALLFKTRLTNAEMQELTTL